MAPPSNRKQIRNVSLSSDSNDPLPPLSAPCSTDISTETSKETSTDTSNETSNEGSNETSNEGSDESALRSSFDETDQTPTDPGPLPRLPLPSHPSVESQSADPLGASIGASVLRGERLTPATRQRKKSWAEAFNKDRDTL